MRGVTVTGRVRTEEFRIGYGLKYKLNERTDQSVMHDMV